MEKISKNEGLVGEFKAFFKSLNVSEVTKYTKASKLFLQNLN